REAVVFADHPGDGVPDGDRNRIGAPGRRDAAIGRLVAEQIRRAWVARVVARATGALLGAVAEEAVVGTRHPGSGHTDTVVAWVGDGARVEVVAGQLIRLGVTGGRRVAAVRGARIAVVAGAKRS